MNMPYRQPGRPQQQQIQVTVENEDIVKCPCGGLALLFNAAFLPKHNIAAIGSKPELVVVPLLICSSCSQRVDPPYITERDAKESP